MSSLSRLEGYVFFIDRGLGRHMFPDALRELGLSVEIHDDHFKQNESDQVWISHASQRNWIIISKDNRIRYRALEKRAFVNANGRGFFFTQAGQSAEVMIEAFSRALPGIARTLERTEPPFMASISVSGNVGLLKL